MTIRVLVLTGDGINCERETARAFSLCGGEPEIVHVNDLLSEPKKLERFQVLALPGGFSFGDDLGSGQILALKLKTTLGDALREFVAKERPIIGICNGFQALTKLGLLPKPFSPRTMAIAHNAGGNFIDRWVRLDVDERSPCLWTQGLTSDDEIILPIRHGEGRVVFQPDDPEKIHNELTRSGQIPLRYRDDINGSYGRIAGVCDPTGLIFGLMPHPEAAVSILQYPDSTRRLDRKAPGIGLRIFANCIRRLR